MKTKIIDISEYWDGDGDESPTVTIKRLAFGEQNDILDQVSNVKMKGKEVNVEPLYGRLRTLVLTKCIVTAPFPTDENYIQTKLDNLLGQFLFEEIDKFNTLRPEKKESSDHVLKE